MPPQLNRQTYDSHGQSSSASPQHQHNRTTGATATVTKTLIQHLQRDVNAAQTLVDLFVEWISEAPQTIDSIDAESDDIEEMKGSEGGDNTGHPIDEFLSFFTVTQFY
jgi:hypothetical protein